ncbi:MAG: hypothetical protein R3D00_22815 [Bacteroidia bacterium]
MRNYSFTFCSITLVFFLSCGSYKKVEVSARNWPYQYEYGENKLVPGTDHDSYPLELISPKARYSKKNNEVIFSGRIISKIPITINEKDTFEVRNYFPYLTLITGRRQGNDILIQDEIKVPNKNGAFKVRLNCETNLSMFLLLFHGGFIPMRVKIINDNCN